VRQGEINYVLDCFLPYPITLVGRNICPQSVPTIIHIWLGLKDFGSVLGIFEFDSQSWICPMFTCCVKDKSAIQQTKRFWKMGIHGV
jgi:hypothetical protein